MGHRLLVVVEIVAHGANDLFGPGNDWKVLDIGQFQVRLEAADDIIALVEIRARDEVLQRGVGQLAAEVDDAVANDRSPGLPAIVQK